MFGDKGKILGKNVDEESGGGGILKAKVRDKT